MSNYYQRAKNKTRTILENSYYSYYKLISKNSYPDFLIIGALKSGTTSLYQYLANHSEIVSSSIKETNYFSWEYYRGIKYYLNFFPQKTLTNNKLVFEACPHYLVDPQSAHRIKKILPKVKIIAILRDLIERAISNYNYFSSPTSFFGIRKPEELDKRNVNQALLDDLQSKEKRIFRQYSRLSLYAKQLKSYYDKFNKESILLLDFDELKSSPKSLLKKASGFLNINYDEYNTFNETAEAILSGVSFKKNENKALNIYNKQEYSLNIDKNLEKQLIHFYSEDVKKLLKLTGISVGWSEKYLS